MSPGLRLALRLYPAPFRRRYGEELKALVEDERGQKGVLLDLLRGAISVRLRRPPRPED